MVLYIGVFFTRKDGLSATLEPKTVLLCKIDPNSNLKLQTLLRFHLPSLQSQKFWQDMLAGQAKNPFALVQFTEGWGSSKKNQNKIKFYKDWESLTQDRSARAVNFYWIITFLKIDVEYKSIGT